MVKALLLPRAIPVLPLKAVPAVLLLLRKLLPSPKHLLRKLPLRLVSLLPKVLAVLLPRAALAVLLPRVKLAVLLPKVLAVLLPRVLAVLPPRLLLQKRLKYLPAPSPSTSAIRSCT